MSEEIFSQKDSDLPDDDEDDDDDDDDDDDGSKGGSNGIWDLLNIPSPEEDEEDETFDELLVLLRDKELDKMSKEEITSLIHSIFGKRDLLIKALKCEEPSVFKEVFDFFAKKQILERAIHLAFLNNPVEHSNLITEILTHIGDEEEEDVTVQIAQEIVSPPGDLLGLILSYHNRGDNELNDRWLKVVSTLLDRKFFHVAGYIMKNDMIDNFFCRNLDIYSFNKLMLKILDLKISEQMSIGSFNPFGGGDSFGLSNPFGDRGESGGSLKEVILLKIYDDRSPIPINVRSIHDWLYNKGMIPKFLSTCRERPDDDLMITNIFSILSEVSRQLYDTPNNKLYIELTSQNTFNQLFELMFTNINSTVFDKGVDYVIKIIEKYVREREAEREAMTETEIKDEIYEKPIPMHILHILHLNGTNFLATLMDYLVNPPEKLFRASRLGLTLPGQRVLAQPFTEKRLYIVKLFRTILLINNRAVWKLLFLKKRKKLLYKKKKQSTSSSKEEENKTESKEADEKQKEEEKEGEDDEEDDCDDEVDGENTGKNVKEGDIDVEYFERFVDIFFKYDYCNLMHNVFVEILFIIMSAQDRRELQPYGKLIFECVLKHSTLIPRLIEQEKEEKEKGYSGIMGHVVKIVNKFLEKKIEIPSEYQEKWDTFVTGFIAEKNEKYNFVLGKDSSYDDGMGDDDDDDDDDDVMDIDLDEDSLDEDSDENLEGDSTSPKKEEEPNTN